MTNLLQRSTYQHDLDPYSVTGSTRSTAGGKVTITLASDSDTNMALAGTTPYCEGATAIADFISDSLRGLLTAFALDGASANCEAGPLPSLTRPALVNVAVTMENPSRVPWRDEAIFLLKVSRPGFWLTSVWFYLLPLGQVFVFNSWEFWLGCLYVTFPLGLLIYGWNDIADYETDRHNPRKGNFLFGAKASPQQLARLPWRIALVQLPFFITFLVLLGWQALWWIAALLGASALYNGPRGGLKRRPPFDMLNQVGYLLVFVLASWLNHVPQLPWSTFVFGALFAMHSHLFGQVMDVVPDRLAGRNTTAAAIGIVPAKFLLVLLLASEAGLVCWSSADYLLGIFLLGAAVWFILDATLLWRDQVYRTWQMRLFLLGWNAVALLSIPLVWRSGALTVAR